MQVGVTKFDPSLLHWPWVCGALAVHRPDWTGKLVNYCCCHAYMTCVSLCPCCCMKCQGTLCRGLALHHSQGQFGGRVGLVLMETQRFSKSNSENCDIPCHWSSMVNIFARARLCHVKGAALRQRGLSWKVLSYFGPWQSPGSLKRIFVLVLALGQGTAFHVSFLEGLVCSHVSINIMATSKQVWSSVRPQMRRGFAFWVWMCVGRETTYIHISYTPIMDEEICWAFTLLLIQVP